MKRVEGLSAREISRRTGLARDTVARLLAAEKPPVYSRAPAGSILDPFKDWICEQLDDDATTPSHRRREMAVRLRLKTGVAPSALIDVTSSFCFSGPAAL